MNEVVGDLTLICTELGHLLTQKSWQVATAESCTGGWIAQAITAIPGSSGWFERGFVTYSNQSKQEMLGVKTQSLSEYGAVSQEVAAEMAVGALNKSCAQVAIATTGIAGPGGETFNKPVGLVWFGWATWENSVITSSQIWPGERQQIRRAAVEYALSELIRLLKKK